jgi:hypothetical protein
MSEFDEQPVIDVSDQESCGNQGQLRVSGIATENSPEETIRIMRAFPERAKKLRVLIRTISERSLD